LIASVVGRRRVGSQHELQGALRSAGCEVTQATISRDIRELGLEKTRDVLGRPRYVLPERGSRSDPRESLKAILAQFGRRAVQAQNIVVVQSELGSAPAIARLHSSLSGPRVWAVRSTSARLTTARSGSRSAAIASSAPIVAVSKL